MSESTPSPPSGERRRTERSLEEVALRLHAAAIHLLRRLRAADVEAGMTPARLSALSVLTFGGPCSLTELAEAEQVSPPSMSRMVGALEEAGLVTRRRDPDDGRAVRLEATAEGRSLLEEGRERRVGRLAELLSRLEREEVETVARSAEVLDEMLARAGSDEA